MEQKKIAVYSASRLFYYDVIPSIKSILQNGGIDEVVVLTQDDFLPYKTPDNVKAMNVSDQPWFKIGSPNYRNEYAFICLVRVALAKLFLDTDKILALDADTIITGDLSDLWELDMTDYYLAGVAEKRLSVEKGYPYINMGLGFWNLSKVREDHLDDRMITDLNSRRYQWLEQDCINENCKGHVLELDPGYSYSWYAKETNHVRMVHFCADPNWRENELVKAYKERPWDKKPIVMYLCDGLKPCGKTSGCYLNGGQCGHTTDENHAKIKTDERHEVLTPGANGELFFIELQE